MIANIVIAFFAGVLIDILWVRYIQSIEKSDRYGAALISMALGAMSLTGILKVTHDHVVAIPYILGLGIGTFFATMEEVDIVVNGEDEEEDNGQD